MKSPGALEGVHIAGVDLSERGEAGAGGIVAEGGPIGLCREGEGEECSEGEGEKAAGHKGYLLKKDNAH